MQRVKDEATYVCRMEHTSGGAFATSTISTMRDHLWLVHEIVMDADLPEAPVWRHRFGRPRRRA